MKNFINILKNNSNLVLIIIGILVAVYLGYQIINPILKTVLQPNPSVASFDKVSEYLKQ